MPSIMIHLLASYKMNSGAEPLFYIGTVAPDAVKTREEKDITHFRVSKDREVDLKGLAAITERDNAFGEGVLLHLFLDWLWDNESFCSFRENYTGEDWFKAYRSEIAIASSYIYHTNSWCEDVWQKMLACPKENYGKAPGVSDQELREFLKRNHKWHMDNYSGYSKIYSPSFVEGFTDRAVKKYTIWRNLNKGA